MTKSTSDHRARLEACLAGEKVDRPPVALWRHFPVDDQTPDGLAASVVAFQRTYDFDFVKVTPASSFCLKDWGVEDEWRGSTEGTREYTRRVIEDPDDWERLPILDPGKGFLAEQIACLREIVKQLGPRVPVIQTIFNPLSQMKNLAGQQKLLVHMRRYPQQVKAGLLTISESTRRFCEAIKNTGIAGVFYAVQHAQEGLLTEQEYRDFGCAYDFQVLEPVRDFWLNVLHLHGEDVMFDLFLDYPVSVINWHDLETTPSLQQAQMKYSGAVCGGLRQWQTLVLGTPGQVRQEARQAMESTGGKRFILGTGCVAPIIAPHGNILAARRAVEDV